MGYAIRKNLYDHVRAVQNIEILLSPDPLKTIRLGEQLPDWWGRKLEK